MRSLGGRTTARDYNPQSGGNNDRPQTGQGGVEAGTHAPQEGKILWTQEGDDVIVTKGTPQSSFRKTMLRRGGRAAVPKHIMEALGLRSTPHKEERIVWIQRGDEIVVRKGAPLSSPTD